MDQLVTLQIDGKEARVPKGTLLIEAAKTVGVTIPVFCYHAKMKSVGACRMCLVEVEKSPKLQTACTTPVAEGMVVHTNSPRAIQAQHSVIEFLLFNHPLDCPVCDKGGECPLQDNAFGWGLGVSRYDDEKRHFVKPTDLSPEIKLDRERCIMCLRCVRFTREIAGDETLVIASRGSQSEVATLPGRTFDSPFSGNTIEICPVGALTGSRFRFRARIWDLTPTATVCDKCAVGCNLRLQVRKNRNTLYRLWSRENPEVDDGWLCDRGRFDYEYVNSPERLRTPLVRRSGALEPASWDKALAAAREGLVRVAQRQGGEAVGAVGSARGTNEENYLLQKLFRRVFGTNNVDHTLRAHPPASALPWDAATGSLAGLDAAGAILLVGADQLAEQPVLDLRIKKATARGARVLAVGPAETDLGRYGAWLRVEPEGLAAVVSALSQVLIAEGLHDAGFVAERTTGFETFQTAVAPITPEAVAEASGYSVSAEAIRSAARALAQHGPVAILYRRDLLDDLGPAANGALAAAIHNLALVGGAVGPRGAGLFPLLREANEQGSIDVGLTSNRLPGQRAVADEGARADLAALWGGDLPTEPGRSGAEMARGAVRALYLIGQDPATGDPAEAESLRALDFLVVQDVFLTETAKLADVVLPGVTFAERDGTYTSLERRVQRLRPGVVPPGEARPDWRIVRDLANALGAGFDYATPSDVFAEIAEAAPIYRGLTYAGIGKKGQRWPIEPEEETVWEFRV